MAHVLDFIEKLEKSKEFSSWGKDHSKGYLVHAFKMLDKANENIWQIGYYNSGTNLISVFMVGDTIQKIDDAEVFKEQEKLVNPLDIKSVKLNEEEALKLAKEVMNDNYKGNSVFKSFMILQNIDKFGQVWNVTFITEQFKTINVKIDAKDGKCLGHKIVSLIQGK